jgi:hypothetical protein
VLRLNQLVVEGTDSPIRWFDIIHNVEWLRAHPDEDLDPIEVEETGAWCRELGCIFVIRDGKHRFISYLAAGRSHIPHTYKDPTWTSSRRASASTSSEAQS